MLERRSSPRRPTLLGGQIRVAKLGAYAVDCTIRNLSDDGAGVAIPADTLIPRHFALGIVGQAPVPARIVWYRAGRAGLALGERRQLPSRPRSEPCRRAATALASVEADRLQARVDAIVSRRPVQQ